MPQLYETPQYIDQGQWYGKHDQLRQMARNGQASGMVIPKERPESPNARLMAAGIAPPAPPGGAPIIRSFQNNLDSLPSFDQFAQQVGYNPNQIGEVAPQQLQRMFSQQEQQRQLMQQQMTGRFGPQQQQQQMVRVQPGHPVFSPLRLNGFAEGGPVILCRQTGQTQPNWQQDFVVRGIKNCYVVGMNESRVDLQRIHQSPQSWVKLVELRGAMGDSVLVPQNAIAQRGMMQQQLPQGRMLTDQRFPQVPMGKMLLG